MKIKEMVPILMIALFFAGGGTGWFLWQRAVALEAEIRALEGTFSKTRAERSRFEKCARTTPVAVERRYSDCVNAMTDVARALGLTLVIERKELNVNEGIWGLRGMQLRFLFGSLSRRSLLLSLLGYLDHWQQVTPFIVEGVVQEKEMLDLKIILVGI